MRLAQLIDRAAFSVAVFAGGLAAVAGWRGWVMTTVVAGCVAAIAPVASRIAGNADLRRKLGPRQLSTAQSEVLVQTLKQGAPFKIWVGHNRH